MNQYSRLSPILLLERDKGKGLGAALNLLQVDILDGTKLSESRRELIGFGLKRENG